MAKEGSEARILEALEALAGEHGIDVIDVEVVGSARAPIVRVRIDHADEGAATITLDEVASETAWISAAIDGLDPFPHAFTLEVSSPGLARPLRRPRDFERFAGEQVALSTTATEGRRRYTGELLGITDGQVCVRTDEGEFQVPLAEVSKCTVKPEIDFSGKAGKAR